MKRLPILLLTIGLLASCARTTDPASGRVDPASGAAGDDSAVGSDMVKPVGGDLRVGQPWYLVGGMLESSTSTPVMLTFEEARVGGQGPVNTYSADYQATTAGALALGEFVSTRMAGPEPDMAAEAELLDLLGKVDGYTTVEAGELYLFDGEMNVLTYSAAPVAVDPMAPSDAALAMATEVVGMAESEAQAAVEGAGLTYRVVSRDGTGLAVTEDYSVSRINVAIVDGQVTEATIG
ncbi:MAG TPA: META domain-containing protein [Candidatus Limnocylindrales bacterium]|nr:META domain-containing protein [Candidatus Limnocylindrales bacterium]